MRYLKILFFGACLSCLALQCEKKPGGDTEPVPEDTVYVNDTFLQYWFFPKGSWWVYKRTDTSAEVYDTAKVVRVYDELAGPISGNQFFEMKSVNIRHTSNHFKTNGHNDTTQLVSNSRQLNTISSNMHQPYFTFHYFFSWPIDSTTISKGSNGNSILLDTASIDVPIGKPQHVAHLRFKYQGSEIWMARNIGFIKYKHGYDGSVWELKDYHINTKK